MADEARVENASWAIASRGEWREWASALRAIELKRAIDRLKGELPKLRALHVGPVSKARRKEAIHATRTF